MFCYILLISPKLWTGSWVVKQVGMKNVRVLLIELLSNGRKLGLAELDRDSVKNHPVGSHGSVDSSLM